MFKAVPFISKPTVVLRVPVTVAPEVVVSNFLLVV